jgi:hypothetical protein
MSVSLLCGFICGRDINKETIEKIKQVFDHIEDVSPCFKLATHSVLTVGWSGTKVLCKITFFKDILSTMMLFESVFNTKINMLKISKNILSTICIVVDLYESRRESIIKKIVLVSFLYLKLYSFINDLNKMKIIKSKLIQSKYLGLLTELSILIGSVSTLSVNLFHVMGRT